MTVSYNGKTAEEIIGPARTFYIYPSDQKGKKRYFRVGTSLGETLVWDFKYGLCKKEVERWIDYDTRNIEYEKRLEWCRQHYDVKGVITKEDVSSDYFIVESELDDPFALNRKKQGLVFERIERERCEG